MPGPPPSTAALAATIAGHLLGPGALVSRFQAEHSAVFRLDFAPGTPTHVLKIATQDPDGILREQHLLRYLGSQGIPVPALEFTQADYPAANLPFSILPLARGTSAAAIYTQDSRRGSAVFERLGRVLGRVAAMAPASVPGALSAALAQTRELAAWDQHFEALQGSSRPDHVRLYRNVRAIIETQPAWFGNRDGCHLITDGADVFTVIDWGDAGWIWPYVDLARCIYTMRVLNELRGGQWLECLLRGFGAERPLEEGWIATVELWLLYFCVRDAMLFRRTNRDVAGSRLLKIAQQSTDRRWMEGT